ncbi:polysaccharide deacetylase family protein [Streptomyces sp. Vc74B-19]|uniref:polysaccharide deacetylase family protein n=1 Tax=unclassified Streptomyces TaxID=2593676 RepID=UPI001BFC1DA4|nr:MULTISPECIES: polysaccharide deacetylase family protein [unclassified Streptomyces]MBT3163844.1 polysaccharide deacetylase family protein [Streptomyces sp. Vc74B-19]MCO4696375.1 polysaccharide deacetylase family protein [Streptomyces sp. RO-S4]MDU0302076.1 polysaccharide deacetylase family protein [Streptomyces sp. PAL114]
MSGPLPASAGRRAAAVGLPLAAVAAAHIGPAVTWLPAVRRRLFPGLDGAGHPSHIALTFDDGPDPVSTPRFLDALDALGARATFFVLGDAVVRHPAVVRETVRRGHEVAVHGWSHDRPWLPTPAGDVLALRRAADAVRDVTGSSPLWYRPPYGILTSGRWAAARAAGLRPVLWSAWGRDWTARATPASVYGTVEADVRGGGTVLLHDTDRTAAPGCWRAALGALPELVAGWRAAGLTVGTLSEHGTAAVRATVPGAASSAAGARSAPVPGRTGCP